MKKNSLKIIMLFLVVTFLALYISQSTGYYQYTESKKTTLTENAIKRFENDTKKGKIIEAKNYLEKEKNYNNKLSILGNKLSKVIDLSFNKTMNYIFKEMNKTVSSN